MCKRLSERAAGDLLAFVRKVRREAQEAKQSGFDPRTAVLALLELDGAAEHLLAKHGLLTPADDPKVAAVFMEEKPEPETYASVEGQYNVIRSRATGRILRSERVDGTTYGGARQKEPGELYGCHRCGAMKPVNSLGRCRDGCDSPSRFHFYTDGDGCPECGSKNVSRKGYSGPDSNGGDQDVDVYTCLTCEHQWAD